MIKDVPEAGSVAFFLAVLVGASAVPLIWISENEDIRAGVFVVLALVSAVSLNISHVIRRHQESEAGARLAEQERKKGNAAWVEAASSNVADWLRDEVNHEGEVYVKIVGQGWGAEGLRYAFLVSAHYRTFQDPMIFNGIVAVLTEYAPHRLVSAAFVEPGRLFYSHLIEDDLRNGMDLDEALSKRYPQEELWPRV